MKSIHERFPYVYRLKLNLIIMFSGFLWISIGIALSILLAALTMKQLHFVEEIRLSNITAIYEIGFPLFSTFLFSQLFAEEMEERILKWLKSTPLICSLLLAERWVIGIIILLVIYSGSLWIIDLSVFPLPWKEIYFKLLIPSLFLGHLSVAATLIGGNATIGLGLPLFYWTFENFTRGAITGPLFLFQYTFPSSLIDIDWNRGILTTASFILIGISGYIMTKRRY